MHILFVCTGNVCRSVIAERLTRAVAAERGIDDLTAESVGTRALVGFGVEPLAAQTITGLGADASNFSARRLKPEMIARAELVLTMTEQIRDHIAEIDPAARACTFTLLDAYRVAKVSGARTVAAIDSARNDLALVGSATDTRGRPRLVLLPGGRVEAPQPPVEHMRIGRHA